MEIREYGDRDASVVLIQPVDGYDLEGMENEVKLIREMTGKAFRMIAVRVEHWNRDLSPWSAPAVFGNEPFGGGAAEFLLEILKLTGNPGKTYYIGGYSLAGLFALWAATETEAFHGVAAASPSVWFPGFTDHLKKNGVKCETIYLSLGDREEKAKNPVMAAVGGRIRELVEWLRTEGVSCTLEWNEGNHFREPDVRTAKAFAWVLNEAK